MADKENVLVFVVVVLSQQCLSRALLVDCGSVVVEFKCISANLSEFKCIFASVASPGF